MAGGGREAWKDTNTVFTNDKAGMQGCDKEKVKRIVYEMSKVPCLRHATPFFLTHPFENSPHSTLRLHDPLLRAPWSEGKAQEVHVQDSPHFRNEQKKQQQQEAKIARLKEHASKLNHHQLASHTRF